MRSLSLSQILLDSNVGYLGKFLYLSWQTETEETVCYWAEKNIDVFFILIFIYIFTTPVYMVCWIWHPYKERNTTMLLFTSTF